MLKRTPIIVAPSMLKNSKIWVKIYHLFMTWEIHFLKDTKIRKKLIVRIIVVTNCHATSNM